MPAETWAHFLLEMEQNQEDGEPPLWTPQHLYLRQASSESPASKEWQNETADSGERPLQCETIHLHPRSVYCPTLKVTEIFM